MTKVQYTVPYLLKTLMAWSVLGALACEDPIIRFAEDADGGSLSVSSEEPVSERSSEVSPTARRAELLDPVPRWEAGEIRGRVDAARAAEEGYLILDLGEAWTPYLFTEVRTPGDEPLPNHYRETYLRLARGEFPDDHHGDRADRDKYLELFGIPPTLGLLRSRFIAISQRRCVEELDLSPLQEFDDVIAYRRNPAAERRAGQFPALRHQVRALARRLGVETPEAIDLDALSASDRRSVESYLEQAPSYHAIAAAQARLACEGFFEGKGRYTQGVIDWSTHQALAEFERRHRIYGWGFFNRDTLRVLRRTPAEAEHEAVLRVLTERAMHATGVIEDGSTEGNYRSVSGQRVAVRNLEQELRDRIIDAFGLTSPEATLEWLQELGDLPANGELRVAVEALELPEYYSGDMDLFVEIDRGDVWYEFPFDEQGRRRAQPVSNRPRTTLYVRYRDQRIALARFGTTIGGWRTEYVDGTVMYKYKNSPPGDRVWHQIVAAPVWLPPPSTPPRDLLSRTRGGYRVNYHETGPSYASAYGLVAAYHARAEEDDEGGYRIFGDEGIRSHGSVDYNSIMRRHSHGCHRLHNHIAVRLMSFALTHRPHERVGQQRVNYGLDLEHDGETYRLHIDVGGYVFRLREPIPVSVLAGRILGDRETPIEHPIPRWNDEAEAFVDPEGQHVVVDRFGTITPIEMPEEEIDEEELVAESESISPPDEPSEPLSDTARAILDVLPPAP